MEHKEWMTLDQMYEMFGNVDNLKEVFYDWMGANKWLFVHINDLHYGWYDALMIFISRISTSHAFPYYLAAMTAYVLITILTRSIAKKGGTKYYISGWVGVLAIFSVGFLINNVVLVKTLKDHFHYPRPYIALAQDQIYGEHQVTVLDRKGGDPDDDYRSFPSGHASFATLLLVALWPMLSPRLQWAGVGFVFMVGWSRMALGMHFPADIVGAIIITFLVVITLRAIIYYLMRKILRINC